MAVLDSFVVDHRVGGARDPAQWAIGIIAQSFSGIYVHSSIVSLTSYFLTIFVIIQNLP
ncbi:MAG: hypothetical protein U1F63_11510 [Chitinivorax sp.]